MSVQSDAYYLHLDDPQPVTLSATRDGATATDDIDYAARLAPRIAREVFGGIALQTNEQAWNIPHALLVAITDLRPGDTLTHGSTVWHVRDVARDSLQTQWILKCERARV